jgi:GT2 family glycosyltransferase
MQSQSPEIAVIVLTWNNITDTLDCLHSLQKLDYPNFRVLLVDNASSDDTVPVVQQKFPCVQIVENERNLGYAEGNNIGIRHALRGGADFIFILNNDTVIDPTALRVLVSTAQSSPEAVVFCPKIYLYDVPNQIMFAGATWDPETALFKYIGLGEEEKGRYETLSETETASGSAMLVRSSSIQTIGYFDPRFFLLWEELDWCSRAQRIGYKMLFVPGAKVWHKVSRSFGGPSPQYHYYFTRNRLLWFERNLRGRQRVRAFVRCAKETYWGMLESRWNSKSARERAILRAQFRAWKHYITRKFGAQSIGD